MSKARDGSETMSAEQTEQTAKEALRKSAHQGERKSFTREEYAKAEAKLRIRLRFNKTSKDKILVKVTNWQLPAGVDPTDDVLGSLDQSWRFYASPRDGGLVSGWVASAAVKDDLALRKAEEQLVAADVTHGVDHRQLIHPAVGEYRHLIDNIVRTKTHIRSQEVEEVLAGASLLRRAPDATYSALAFADIEWPTIRAIGWPAATVAPSLTDRSTSVSTSPVFSMMSKKAPSASALSHASQDR